MSTSNIDISRQFPTTSYKRFWYPTRPLFTFLQGVIFLGLGQIGLLPVSWALWMAAAFAFDDLPLTPVMNVITAINNLVNGRKQTKAIIMLISLGLAALSGGLLGYFVLSQSASFMSAITLFTEATSCSPIFICIGGIFGATVAHKTNVIGPFLGIALGVSIASWIPASIVPLTVEMVFICSAALTFCTSIAVKQLSRLYYRFQYGHSNADGYRIDDTPEKQEQFIEAQAKRLGVTPDAFKQVTKLCRDEVKRIKSQSSLLDELSGMRQPLSNAFKDIYHGLMRPDATDADLRATADLIRLTYDKRNIDLFGDVSEREGYIVNAGFFAAQSIPERRLLHQACIVHCRHKEDYSISGPFISALK